MCYSIDFGNVYSYGQQFALFCGFVSEFLFLRNQCLELLVFTHERGNCISDGEQNVTTDSNLFNVHVLHIWRSYTKVYQIHLENVRKLSSLFYSIGTSVEAILFIWALKLGSNSHRSP